MLLDVWLRAFEDALETRDAGVIGDARRELKERLKEFEEWNQD